VVEEVLRRRAAARLEPDVPFKQNIPLRDDRRALRYDSRVANAETQWQ
jgi:hypothetical protein